MKRKITAIYFPNDGLDGESPYQVGVGVTSISEHQPAGGLDRWYYDVEFVDGHMERLFKFNLVVFEKGE